MEGVGEESDATIGVVERLAVTRERAEELERASLSSWAALAAETKGREVPEEADPHRTAYQQDVDRIVASRAFRRLAGKTHGGVPGEPVQRRTRLEHALQTARVAKAMGRGLRLNEDLVEAVALGSDIGAPAFGPAGDEALDTFADPPFRHAEQSVRVVERLERGGEGLNLTWEVRDGIGAHSADAAPAATLEGQVVRIAARLVDIAGSWIEGLARRWIDDHAIASSAVVLGPGPAAMLDGAIGDVVRTSAGSPEIRMSRPVSAALDASEGVLDARVVRHPHAMIERARAVQCLRGLGLFYLEHPRRVPGAAPPATAGEPGLLLVLDHLADLTDAEAVAAYRDRFLPTT